MTKLTNAEVAQAIERDGIGNALALIEPDALDDPFLALLWRLADAALEAVEKHLEVNP